ncbi:hydantoinase/oxoprolinase family protein [Baekduia soli]|nr:hydantoinase/oxoprolinase family protein [Baekduia soli]
MYRVGVDIGGTFTDVVVADEAGGIVRAKALTTPKDYTEGVTAAVSNAAGELGTSLEALMAECDAFVNGTTVVTNSIAQGKGRNVGLLTTRGFKQSIYIHRGIREIQLDLQKETRPPDIVRQRHVAEIDERVSRSGEVLVELNEDDVRREVARLVEQGVDAIAVCFLWSFRHPVHERRAGEIIAELYPDLFVTLSCDIYPRIREYERMNTALLNAFVSEGAETYIGKLTARTQELGLREGRISFMQSMGGHISPTEAMAEPIHLSHSGPVGGVVAATHFAKVLGEGNIITADLGGTSFDTALIREGRPAYAHRTTINRLLTGLSIIDIHAIGAGGGSICWIDDRGLPQMGPHSAGGYPGPACYGNGGTAPTITDANLVLGLIDPLKFWGGTVTLDVDAAKAALQPLADQLGQDLMEVAAGFHHIAVTQMGTAIEKVSLGRGYDPRDFTVVGYGGGSGLFLGEVCRDLGIRRLVMPGAAATFSAYGLLFADAIHAESTTAQWIFSAGETATINELYDGLEERAVAALRHEGFSDDDIVVRREADVKFAGQAFEISMTWPGEEVRDEDREDLSTRFVQEYERVYGPGSAWDGFPIELHTARVVASGITPKPPTPSAGDDLATSVPEPSAHREVRLGDTTIQAAVHDGPALAPGAVVDGPALVDDVDTTLLVPPGARLEVDGLRNYVFTIDVAAPAAAPPAAVADPAGLPG